MSQAGQSGILWGFLMPLRMTHNLKLTNCFFLELSILYFRSQLTEGN